jgi:flagellar secretion chaperone FliS
MSRTAQQHQYLEAKVLTATQPQLHLMLLEGAIRFGRQARRLWDEPTAAVEVEHLLDRTIDLAEAMVEGVQGRDREISERLEELYAYMFRELVAIRFNRDVEKFDHILQLLRYERETWQQACELCDREGGNAHADDHGPAATWQSPPSTAITPISPLDQSAISGGLSLEA